MQDLVKVMTDKMSKIEGENACLRDEVADLRNALDTEWYGDASSNSNGSCISCSSKNRWNRSRWRHIDENIKEQHESDMGSTTMEEKKEEESEEDNASTSSQSSLDEDDRELLAIQSNEEQAVVAAEENANDDESDTFQQVTSHRRSPNNGKGKGKGKGKTIPRKVKIPWKFRNTDEWYDEWYGVWRTPEGELA